MSIEVTGPEKYEFQDCVCLLTALRLRDREALQAFIEPEGLEDALFRIHEDGAATDIELQVKGSQKRVSVGTIAECLMHFPARSSEHSLLERQLDSPNRFVLLTMSGRCDDESSCFCGPRPWHLYGHEPASLPLATAKKLLSEIAHQHSRPGSRLETLRHNKCLELSSTLTPRKLRAALSRVLIEDQTTKEIVISGCEAILKRIYLIPDDRLASAVEALLAEIRMAKYDARRLGLPVDAWPRLKAALAKLASRSVRPSGYLERGDESHWSNDLSSSGVLLLSGRPRCGKTFAARALAAGFQEIGYEVREYTELGEAERFLLDTSLANRLCVLDDPLGALRLHPEASRILEKLRWLIGRIRPNRKLVVAQSQDQILEIMGKRGLSDCALGPLPWKDLSDASTQFLQSTWIGFADQFDVLPQVKSTIEQFLLGDLGGLEIGCLYHLAGNAGRLPENPTAEQALQVARQDASSLGLSLAHSDHHMRVLLCAMAIGSAPGKPVSLKDLAFLLDQHDSSLPGKRDGIGYVVFGGSGETEEEFPSYRKVYTLSHEIQAQIDALERRGFITISDSRLGFSHAFYGAAGRAVLNAPTTLFAKHAARLFERSLFCLSLETSRAAIENADWLLTALGAFEQEREQILTDVEQGLECIFPAVRDACFGFLLRHIEKYEVSSERQLDRWVDLAVSRDLVDLKWHNGQAWIPSRRGFLSHLEERGAPSEIESDRDHLESDDAHLLAPERAARVAEFAHAHPDTTSPALVQALLGFDEVLIRAKSAAAWIALDRTDDESILDRIFGDNHPKVLLDVLDECILRWDGLSLNRRENLAQRIKVAVCTEAAAIAVLPRMTVFERVEYSGENPPWDLFETVMPAVLAALPQGVLFSGPRLYSVMKSAARQCRAEAVVEMCRSWIRWIQLQIAAGRFEQYELSVTDILIDATRSEPEKRDGLVNQLLCIQPTSALMQIVCDVQSSWNALTPAEQQKYLELLQDHRPDRIWLHAIAITRGFVPERVLIEILGEADSLQAAPRDLIASIPSDLLNAAIGVQCGVPGEFWNIAHSSDLFDQIVRIIESDSNHPLFETTFWEIVLHDDDARMIKVVENAETENLEHLFQLLLSQRVECTGMFLPKSWARLLERADPEAVRNWLRRMSSVAACCIDDLTELSDWLIRKTDRHALLELLPNDFNAEKLAIEIAEGEVDEQFGTEKLKDMIVHAPPRLFGTYDHVRARLEKAGLHPRDLLSSIDSARQRCFEERKKIEAQHGKRQENTPVNWVS